MGKTLLGLFLFASSLTAFPGFAIADSFLKIDDIPGQCQKDEHKDWIDVLSVSIGGAGPSRAKPAVPPVRWVGVTKRVDAASPALRRAVALGTRMPQVILELTKEDDPNALWRAVLTNALATSYGTIGTGSPTVKEQIRFDAEKIEWYARVRRSSGALTTWTKCNEKDIKRISPSIVREEIAVAQRK